MQIFVGWLLLLASALPVFAQSDATFEDEIDVRLVEIEVVVHDAQGRPVTGLVRDDFEVRQGRKRLEITHFSAFEDGERRPTGTGKGAAKIPEPPRTADDRLYLAIFVDHAFLGPGELADVIPALREFLRDHLRPQDRVLLAEANLSLEIRHGFTTVPELIDDELRQLEPQAPRGQALNEFPRLLQEIERVAQRGADVPTLSRDEHPMMLKAQIESFVDQTHHELSRSTHQLHRLIPALAGLPGRKEVLYVSGTVPADAGERLMSAWTTAFGTTSVYQQQRSSTSDADDFGRLVNADAQAAVMAADTNELFRRVADAANADGVRLHVLDTGGLRQSASSLAMRGTPMTENSPNAALSRRANVHSRLGDPQVFKLMAEATGGRVLIHSRDYRAALDQVADDLRTYYLLAFQPLGEADELHGIRVRLKDRKRRATTRHSQAYRSRDRDRAAAAWTVSALILGEAENPLGVEVYSDPAKPVEGKKGLVRLPLHLVFPVDKLALVPDSHGHRGQVSIYLTAGDLEQGASQVQKTVLPLRFTPEQLEDSRGRTIDYKVELPVALGSRRVAVTLRDDLRPLAATVVLGLTGGASPAQ